MTGASADLLQAVYGLHRAAEAEFEGNAYYQVANEIAGLIEVTGWDEGGVPVGKGAAYGFASMLAEVRKAAEASITGNRFYQITNKLDLLASYLTSSVKETAAEGAIIAKPAAPEPTFSELAAASKARVEEAAASLGIAVAHHAAPSHAEAASAADGGLERRSSEPCAMAELAPPAMEPVAPAAIPAKAPPARSPAEAAQSLGSPAAPAGHGAAQGLAPAAAAVQASATPAFQSAAPAHDSPAASAGQTIEGKKPGEAKPKQKKTLFKLWLHLAFGRKD